jgi:hypothetical protein
MVDIINIGTSRRQEPVLKAGAAQEGGAVSPVKESVSILVILEGRLASVASGCEVAEGAQALT